MPSIAIFWYLVSFKYKITYTVLKKYNIAVYFRLIWNNNTTDIYLKIFT